MSEQNEDLKNTIVNEAENAAEIRASEETRIYDARIDGEDRHTTQRHTWIGEPDDRSTRIASKAVDDRSTRIARSITDERETIVVGHGSSETEESGKAAKKIDAGAVLGKAKDIGGSAARAGRLAVHDVRNVKVADKKKFSRFLRIVGVLVMILIIEFAYFRFASHVKKMPDEIKETQKELELTQKENKLLEKEIEALGDYDSVEELKASWERLQDKVDKAAAGTYY